MTGQTKQPLPQLCRPSEPLICLHHWTLGCVSSHCLASLPHVGVLLISTVVHPSTQGSLGSLLSFAVCCVHELEAYHDETKKRCSGPDRKDQSLPFLDPFGRSPAPK